MSFKKIIVSSCLLIPIIAFSGIENSDWQNYLTRSCNVTTTGGLKKFTGELNFWATVDVSMDSWASMMTSNSPENLCGIYFPRANQQVERMQCLATYTEQWEWYRRCKPVVVMSCRKAGGRC
jgi:uncharacterized protein YbbK (DUF523 family)